MLALQLFGTLSLRDDTHRVPLTAQQNRPLSLLAVLALGGRDGMSRHRVETYLWPEGSAERARHALDQAVYGTRRSLGNDPILANGQELRLNPESVVVDVWQFDDAIHAQRWATAAEMYKGSLLDGFHFGESRELEAWIDTHRARLRHDYQNAIELLADQAAEAGDDSQSLSWRQKLVTADPLSSRASKKLMLALAAAGDRAAAVKCGRIHQELVRQELEIDPDAEIEQLIQTMSSDVPLPPRIAGASQAIATASVSPTAPPNKKDTRRRYGRLSYITAALAILVSVTGVWSWTHPSAPNPVVRYAMLIDSADAMVPATPWSGRIDISPDGSRLAYIGGPRSQLLLRERNQLRAVAIAGTEGVVNPFFSPDGSAVGFLEELRVGIAPINGGAPFTVTDSLAGVAGASWGPDNFIYADGSGPTALLRVEAKPNAVPKWFTVLDTAAGEVNHSWPDVLPNGKGVLFAIRFERRNGKQIVESSAIGVAEIPSGRHRVIVNDALYARYAASGYLLYVTSNKTLMVVPFDQNSMKVTGKPTSLSEGIRLGYAGSADLAVSAAGRLVYATGSGAGESELVWVTRDGKQSSVDSTWPAVYYGSPTFSPDGKTLAVSRATAAERISIWLKPLNGSAAVRLSLAGDWNNSPTWTPDGKSITFSSDDASGTFHLLTRRIDGSAQSALELREKRNVFYPQWSPDGKWLIFETAIDQPGAGDILGLRPGIDTAPLPLLAGKYTETSPNISPNGRWLAYASNETGTYEVYVVPFPNIVTGKWRVSAGGGTEPVWSHEGTELFYRDGSRNLVAVGVKNDPLFAAGSATILFPAAGFESDTFTPQYAVAPDDQRFLMIRNVAAATPDKLIFVEHWFEELKR